MFTCTAGDILEFPATKAPEALAEAKLQAGFFVRALGLMNYDAIGLGEKDFAYGPDYLREAAKTHKLKLVCANAMDDRTKKLIFDPYVVTEKAGVKVGFLAVVSPERHVIAPVESDLLEKKVSFDDPSEAVRKYLPELRKKSDLVVLLAHTGIETAEFLAKDLDVDVVIVGHYPAILNTPEREGNKVIAMAGAKSERYGTLDLTLGADGKISEATGTAELVMLKGPAVSEIDTIFQEMDKKQKDMRRDRQLADQRARDTLKQQELAAAVHGRGGIMGAESCKSCHQAEYDAWLQTPHATAFATLAEADAWDDPECVGCHVTGVADKHHIGDPNISPDVWNVQCEECHGAASEHARDGTYLGSGESTCKRCHDAQNSPNFDYELYKSYGIH